MTAKRIVPAFLLVVIIAVSNMPVAAQDQEYAAQRKAKQKACSAKTLQGSYGYYGNGTVKPNPFGIPEGPFTSMGIATFDGEGTFTWTSSDFPGQLLTGTYSVNADCTADLMFIFPDGSSGPGFFIIVDEGKEFFSGSPPGAPVAHVLWLYKRQ
ncbi:MAG: hypothetical protein AB1631_05525 [Acidobacteriota bacterium]